MTRINGWACCILVALRLVIGWHFLVEGLHKIHTHQLGKTSTNTPWTSEGFFREGYGPAAEWARHALHIDVGDFKERFATDGVRGELFDYKEQVERHYRLTPNQSLDTRNVMMKDLEGLEKWLAPDHATNSKKSVVWGTVELKSSIPDQLSELDAKAKAIREIEDSEKPAFNSDVDKSRLRSLKNEMRTIQTELGAALDGRLSTIKSNYLAAVENCLTDDQKRAGPLPEFASQSRVAMLDKMTMWSHVVLGGLLLVGLFSRLSSLLLALFLLSVTLIAPAVPWAPTPPGSTGHYLYINLYTIEMIALLALTFLPTGRWFGLDALFSRAPRSASPVARE
jgi:uncharacterized membrane protein YphA (DoxX/SURF4 family)